MDVVVNVANLLETTRTRGVALAATMALGDELATAVASMQLLACLDHLRSLAPGDPVAATALADAVARFGPTLRGSASVSPSDVHRLLRWMVARNRSVSTANTDPHLFETRARRAGGHVSFECLHVMDSRFRDSELACS